ncbi:unnamed protein product [Lepeophtheirus salmonis]|uniref:(salmon louse) hypothetical protein n=1 Tax=Lepeophtheirus salmonis TaxID=72036 RepID=A0A7R8H2N2_LEPSM|nr:unnamed protein product [Lepeophtheirus salmonis]CAF2817943.1 unnamed protein product [Lepeophtheirus salmonis]
MVIWFHNPVINQKDNVGGWREAVCILGTSCLKKEKVKINDLLICAGAKAEQVIEARTSENPDLEVEAREALYSMKQSSEENRTTYLSRIVELTKQGSSLQMRIYSSWLSCSMDGWGKQMVKGEEVKVKECLEIQPKCEAVGRYNETLCT